MANQPASLASTLGPTAIPAATAMPHQERIDAALAFQYDGWRDGSPKTIDDVLRAFPDLAAYPDVVLDLIYGEYFARRDLGQNVAIDDYCQRFPAHADQLRQQSALHEAIVCGPSDTLSPHDIETFQLPGYTLLGEIGRGGMGIVYKARQDTLDRLVAIKVILSEYHFRSAWRSRFAAEATAIARLRHPNFVQIFDYGVVANQPYLVLEWIDGGTLAERIAGVGQDTLWAAEITQTLAVAIHFAHEKQLVHRDLKPANILLTENGVPKITDLGLSVQLTVVDHAAECPTEATPTAPSLTTLYGSPPYMAPEQLATPRRPLTPASDIYALGVILYESLTGQVPFLGASLMETLDCIRQESPLPPRQLRPDVSRDLETICLKCLDKEPARRYASASDLAEDLRRFRAGLPIKARRVGPLERTWQWCRRNPSLAGLALLLILTVSSGLVGVTALWYRSERMRI